MAKQKFYRGTAEVYDFQTPNTYYAVPVSAWASSAKEFRRKVTKEQKDINCGIVQIALQGTKLEKQIQENDIQRVFDRPDLYL